MINSKVSALIAVWCGALLFAPAGSVMAQQPVPHGGFSGIVVDEGGNPVPGARVVYMRMPKMVQEVVGREIRVRPAAGEPAFSATASVDEAGRFDVDGLIPGTYSVCVTGPIGFLDTCLWSARVGLSLAEGERRGDLLFTLRRGAVVQISVEDPEDLVRLGTDLADFRNLIVGVTTPSGAFYRPEAVKKNGSTWKFALTVPFEKPFRLWVFSRHLSLRKDDGTPLNMKGPNEEFTVQRGQSAFEFRLAVAGLLQGDAAR